jgi:hypothetical protein
VPAAGGEGGQSGGRGQRPRVRGALRGQPTRGTSNAKQGTFDYLDGREGRLIMIFYGQPNRDSINSVEIFLMDPKYEDAKMVLVELKEILDIGSGRSWVNASHHISYSTIWHEREQDSCTTCPI